MNAAAHRAEGNASAPVLYMALELSNTTWKVVFADGARCRRVVGELVKLQEAVGLNVVRVWQSTKAMRAILRAMMTKAAVCGTGRFVGFDPNTSAETQRDQIGGTRTPG